MAREKQILVLTCLVVVLPIVVDAFCPSKEDIPSCICSYPTSMWGPRLECRKIDKEELVNVASHFRGRKVYSLTIENSTLGSIPHDVFKGIKLIKLRIIYSILSALTDGSEALVGLEDQLQILEILDCVYKNKWDWSVLRNLKKLEDLTVRKSLHLETIGEDLMKNIVSSVKTFSFVGNDISSVSDHAFDSFKNIEYLSIHSNKIKNVKRTMLPNPALKFKFFGINGNLIEQFPEDMFTNMPNLRYLYIAGNKILVLDQKILSPVWEKLLILTVDDNPMRCDCRMSWLLETKNPYDFTGACASPPELKGKKLKVLKSEDLVCYV